MKKTRGTMNLFKKKYRYIQAFDVGHSVVSGDHLGLYRLGSDADLDRLLKPFVSRVLFPHFGFSFYEDPPGRIIQTGRGDIPSLFQARRLLNLGQSSLLKRVSAHDMFTDQGLATYRAMAFQMMMGTAESLPGDMACVCDPRVCPGCDADWIQALAPFVSHVTVDPVEIEAIMAENTAMYDEVFHLDLHSTSGYPDFVYLTANTMTSLELSHATVLNIIRSGAVRLRPVFQSPLCPDQDLEGLSEIFLYDKETVNHVSWHGRIRPLFGIFPGLFGFEGAIFDVATGLVSGKRKSMVRFLLFLNGINLLAKGDLRYLI